MYINGVWQYEPWIQSRSYEISMSVKYMSVPCRGVEQVSKMAGHTFGVPFTNATRNEAVPVVSGMI